VNIRRTRFVKWAVIVDKEGNFTIKESVCQEDQIILNLTESLEINRTKHERTERTERAFLVEGFNVRAQ
jgi:hypothetical protein